VVHRLAALLMTNANEPSAGRFSEAQRQYATVVV